MPSNIRRARSRDLRARQTRAESLLWQQLRNRCLSGLKFRRQHPIGPFIVDFYCAEVRLVIELNGSIHDLPEVEAYDRERNNTLMQDGYRVAVFCNEQVFEQMDRVLAGIQEITALPATPPLHLHGEGAGG